jgi:ATPase subunit of ABC transporter with duplicated ATPase domains
MTAALLEVRGLDLDTLEGRPLFRGLRLTLADEQVAVVGRNGVGKSTLLSLLAGVQAHDRVVRRGRSVLVPQELDDPTVAAALHRVARLIEQRELAAAWQEEAARAGLRPMDSLARDGASRGELRKLCLLTAFLEAPDLLLLDEPTEDLDEAGLDWLEDRVRSWRGGLVVVSHDPRLLGCFEHFFVVSESGCRHVPGSFTELQAELGRAHTDQQAQYLRNLQVLADKEAHDITIRRRRARKKAVGRVHELDRCTPKIRLNRKRANAQVSQGRVAGIREQRLHAARSWAKETRRALEVQLPLEVVVPEPPAEVCRDVIVLDKLSLEVGGRRLFDGLDLQIGRDRVALIGPNGAGKTSLLRAALGELQPSAGRARSRRDRIGAIAQGATDWMLPDSLLSKLSELSDATSPEALARILLAHRFPLALAERPLASLSPGERVRAALICLFQRRPVVDLLVLDEPTFSLDLVGTAALTEALRAWRGGLVVASHDRGFLEAIGVERWVELGGTGL